MRGARGCDRSDIHFRRARLRSPPSPETRGEMARCRSALRNGVRALRLAVLLAQARDCRFDGASLRLALAALLGCLRYIGCAWCEHVAFLRAPRGHCLGVIAQTVLEQRRGEAA